MIEVKCFVKGCRFHAKESDNCGLKTISIIPIETRLKREKGQSEERTRKSAECQSFMGA